MHELGEIWDKQPARACHLARQVGFLLAAELNVCGVDFSFTPVLIMEIQPKIQGVTCRALRGFDGSKDNFFWAHLDTHGFIKRLDFLVA